MQKGLPKLFCFCNKKHSVSRIGSRNCYRDEESTEHHRLSPTWVRAQGPMRCLILLNTVMSALFGENVPSPGLPILKSEST